MDRPAIARETIVALWWGGHVGPQLFSLAFPALLPPDNLLHQLDPELG